MDSLRKVLVYGVGLKNPEDELYDIESYWHKFFEAEDRAKKIKGKIIQVTAWRDEDGNHYRFDTVHLNEILVSVPTREEVLNKLTTVEKKVLGIK